MCVVCTFVSLTKYVYHPWIISSQAQNDSIFSLNIIYFKLLIAEILKMILSMAVPLRQWPEHTRWNAKVGESCVLSTNYLYNCYCFFLEHTGR